LIGDKAGEFDAYFVVSVPDAGRVLFACRAMRSSFTADQSSRPADRLEAGAGGRLVVGG
jgi:hypothetical protein